MDDKKVLRYIVMNNVSGEPFELKQGRRKESCIYSSLSRAEEIAESLEEDGYCVSIISYKVEQ